MNRAKARGTAFESAVVAYLQADGWPAAERRAQRGVHDAGDVAGLPFVCLELKATGIAEFGRAVAECEKEAVNAKARYSAVVFKRRQHGISEAYAVMSLAQLSELLQIASTAGWLR